MGKKKKTLKQKKMAELRQLKEPNGTSSQEQTIADQPTTHAFSYSFSQTKPQTKSATSGTPSIYSLKHDLRKTLLVSLTIMFALILLYTLLHNRAFVLPLVSLRY